MSTKATGPFDVTSNRQPPYDVGPGASFARASVTKQFHGDFEGSSTGEMLTAVTEVKGSAGYVLIERATGVLNGKQGTFVLQHSGIMTRGAADLRLSVVPDSGTAELKGIAGTMKIDVIEGKHMYTFEYSLG
ncbi:MAG: hypothetical protein JWN04_2653 [Myxococcaceae bacterium]|nr:hypothetical protein [Myxococcaceae bacterium]